jgi:hypothetical protein
MVRVARLMDAVCMVACSVFRRDKASLMGRPAPAAIGVLTHQPLNRGPVEMIEALDDKRAQKKAERSDGPGKLPVCQRLRRGGCGVASLPKDRLAS